MSVEIKGLIETLNRQFEEFKSAEKAGREDLAEKLNAAMSATEAKIDEVKTAVARSQAADSIAEKADEYKSAFMSFARKGIESKALSSGSEADGGYAIPEGLVREVGRIMTETSPVRQLANVVTTSTATYEKLYSNADAAAGWVAETGSRNATNTPTLSQVLITPGEMYAKAEVTQRLIDDAMFDVEGWLISELADKFARLENTAFVSGDGTNKPKGFLNATKVAAVGTPEFNKLNYIASAANNAISGDDLINLVYTLKPSYRANAAFVMNRLTLASLRKLKDGVDGQYLWSPAMAAGQPSTLLGFPVYEMADMPVHVAGGSPLVNTDAIVLADWRKFYTIVDRVGIRTLRDPYSNKPYVQFYATRRVGGDIEDSHAGVALSVVDA